MELIAGLCPSCAGEKATELSALQRCFDRALAAGDSDTASVAIDEIESYERLYGVHLIAAPSVAVMRRVVSNGA